MSTNNRKINLRDWRSESRERKTNTYKKINIYVLIITSLIIGMFALIQMDKIKNQQSINNYLKSEMKVLDSDLLKIQELEEQMNEILDRMNVINSLQSNKSDLVILMDEIASVTPKDIKLKSFSRESDVLKIEGISISQFNISEYLKNITNSEVFNEPKLERVVSADKVDGFERSFF